MALGGRLTPQFRHRAQDRGGEAVAVRPRPDAIIAGPVEAIGVDRGRNARDQLLRVRPGNIGNRHRRITEPTAVRRPAVDAHRVAPADYIVAHPVCRVRRLEHDPAMHREDALPGASRGGEHDHACRLVVGRRRQHAGARPVGVVPAARAAVGGIERGANNERCQENEEDGEHDELSARGSGGRHDIKSMNDFRPKRGGCRRPPLAMRRRRG